MPTSIYTQKDNGDLKLMAEIEETISDEEAVELLLENAPRTKAEEFVVISGDLDDGTVSTVSQKETVTIKWASSRNGDEAEEVQRPRKAKVQVDEPEEAEEEEAPKPRRRGRPPGSKNKPKTGAARSSARKPAAKTSSRGGSKRTSSQKGGSRISSFKRNAASDE